MSRYCTQCGTQNQDEAKFCKHCGVSMLQTSEAPVAAPDAAQDTAADPMQTQITAAEQEHDSRERERRAAMARLEADIREKAEAAAAMPFPHEQPTTPPVAAPAGEHEVTKGSNALLVGGIAIVVIAFLLIGGGGLWWSTQHPQRDKGGRSPAVASSAASTVALPAPVRVMPSHSASIAAPAEVKASIPQAAPLAEHPAQSKSAPEVRSSKSALRASKSARSTSAPAHADHRAQARASAPSPAQKIAPIAPTPAPAVPKPMGRIDTLRAALSACRDKGNFFARQLCIQETRWKYCGAPLSPDQLWGKIPECPNSSQQSNRP